MTTDKRSLLSPRQAAKYLGVHVGTLANWRYYGTGPRFITNGRKVMYDIVILRRFASRTAQEAQ